MIVSYEDTNIPTPEDVRNGWCFGLPLTDENGNTMSDELLKKYIMAAVKYVERQIGIYLKPMVIACNPEERGLEQGVDYEIAEPPYDYNAFFYRQWGFLQLRERPVQELHGFKLILPNGQIIIDFIKKPEWIKLYKKRAQIHIVPYGGDPTIFTHLGSSITGYPFVAGGLHADIPQMFYVDYIAGYPLNGIPEDVVNAVGKKAAIDVLGVAGDAVMAGIAGMSTTIDGLTESYETTASSTSATYGSRILQYQRELDDFFDERKGGIRSSERGFTISGL